MPTRVVLESGNDWLDYLIGFGTAGAALAAAWAARAAQRSTKATEALIALEKTRDERSADEELWHHARRVSVDLVSVQVTEDPGAVDHRLRVTNSGAAPVLRCRLKIVAGDATWGPQLVGTIAPGASVIIIAELRPGDPATEDVNAYVRFVDVGGAHWISRARGDVAPADPNGLNEWISEGRAWAERADALSLTQRGVSYGVFDDGIPGLDEWRAVL